MFLVQLFPVLFEFCHQVSYVFVFVLHVPLCFLFYFVNCCPLLFPHPVKLPYFVMACLSWETGSGLHVPLTLGAVLSGHFSILQAHHLWGEPLGWGVLPQRWQCSRRVSSHSAETEWVEQGGGSRVQKEGPEVVFHLQRHHIIQFGVAVQWA